MFKISGGKYRGSKLLLPPKTTTRPTSTRAREALFNCLFSLDFQMNCATVIDGFAGSGAIGLECLSRGATACVFVENNTQVQKVLMQNIHKLKCANQSSVLSSFDLINESADFVFLDPPYFSKSGDIPLYKNALHQIKKHIKPGAIIVIETDVKESPDETMSDVDFLDILFSKTYGTIKLMFCRFIETKLIK